MAFVDCVGIFVSKLRAEKKRHSLREHKKMKIEPQYDNKKHQFNHCKIKMQIWLE